MCTRRNVYLGHLEVALGLAESGESEVPVGMRCLRPHQVALVPFEEAGEAEVRFEVVRVEGDGVPVLGLEQEDLGKNPVRLRAEIKLIVFTS